MLEFTLNTLPYLQLRTLSSKILDEVFKYKQIPLSTFTGFLIYFDIFMHENGKLFAYIKDDSMLHVILRYKIWTLFKIFERDSMDNVAKSV